MDRARAYLALPHQTSHHIFTLNLLDGFHFFFFFFCLDERKNGASSVLNQKMSSTEQL